MTVVGIVEADSIFASARSPRPTLSFQVVVDFAKDVRSRVVGSLGLEVVAQLEMRRTLHLRVLHLPRVRIESPRHLSVNLN